ncbi:MAG: TnpV protein [Oscillospiraceae bacterium]|nr:TnpV protein [Oscillospiraceae bacterium]
MFRNLLTLSLYTIPHRFTLAPKDYNGKSKGITEKLKADNQKVWIGRMNALREAVTETVNAEVVFV